LARIWRRFVDTIALAAMAASGQNRKQPIPNVSFCSAPFPAVRGATTEPLRLTHLRPSCPDQPLAMLTTGSR
jgi:hypothetical protein